MSTVDDTDHDVPRSIAGPSHAIHQKSRSINGALVGVNQGSIHQYFGGSSPPEQRRDVQDVGMQLFDAISITDQQFIGRHAEMQELARVLISQDNKPATPRVVTITGLGGMGKTQLMLRFAQSYQQTFSSIIWLDASSESNLRQSLVALARRVAELSEQSSEARELDEGGWILRARLWLSRTAQPGWLLLMDNYDEPSIIPGYSSHLGYDIRSYFPQQRRGSILITSRARLDIFDHQLQLSKLTGEIEGLQILRQRSGRAISSDTAGMQAKQLAERLDGLPLALSTAGEYLRHAPDLSFGDYLDLYEQKRSELESNSELLAEFSGSTRDRVLFTTWNISYETVTSIDRDAARLLRFLVYFDPGGVWFELFRYCKDGSPEVPDWLAHVSSDQTVFRRAMKCLGDHSFVILDADRQLYTMHRCVNDWLVATTKKYCDDFEPFLTACKVLSNHFVGEEQPAYWLTDSRIEPHILHLEKFMEGLLPSPPEDKLEFAKATYDMAIILARRGKLEKSEAMFQRSIDNFEDSLGAEDESTLRALNCIGIMYQNQGKLKEAEEMYQRALNGFEKLLGPEHTSTLDTNNNLALLYYNQGKVVKAEVLFLQVLAGFEKVLGPDRRLTLFTVNNLGLLYHHQGRSKEAVAMYKRALAGFEKTLGADHTSTLSTLNNLGNVYRDEGRLKEAEAMYQRALVGFRQALGPDHRHSVLVANNIEILRRRGKERGKSLSRLLHYFRKE